jgi:hypothetical protein
MRSINFAAVAPRSSQGWGDVDFDVANTFLPVLSLEPGKFLQRQSVRLVLVASDVDPAIRLRVDGMDDLFCTGLRAPVGRIYWCKSSPGTPHWRPVMQHAGEAMQESGAGSRVDAKAGFEATEEDKLIRRLQMMMNMVMQVIAQDGSLTIDEASQMIADSRKAALAMFPGKELAYELIWRPRFQRLMRERFRIM